MSSRERRVGDLADLVNGFPFDSRDFQSEGQVPLVRIRDILSEPFETFLAEEQVPASARVEDGDVVIGMDGDFNVVHWTRGTAALNQRLCLLRSNGQADARFLAYSLPPHLKVINDLTYATTVKHLSSAQVRAIRLPAPDLAEQRAIADFLDRETARIDTLIAEQQRLIELLRERRSLTVASVLSGLSGGTRLKHRAVIQTGVTLNGEGNADWPEWPYLRVANVQVGRVDLAEVKTIRLPPEAAAASTLLSGDVLMTEGGDIDKLGRGALWSGEVPNALHQNHVFAVRPDARLVPTFLVYWLDGPEARTYFLTTAKQTTNLAATNKWTLGNLPLACPPIEEQRRIVAYLDGQTAKIDTLITETEKFIDLARERRSALITAAVTGQIDVTTSAA